MYKPIRSLISWWRSLSPVSSWGAVAPTNMAAGFSKAQEDRIKELIAQNAKAGPGGPKGETGPTGPTGATGPTGSGSTVTAPPAPTDLTGQAIQ